MKSCDLNAKDTYFSMSAPLFFVDGSTCKPQSQLAGAAICGMGHAADDRNRVFASRARRVNLLKAQM
jgi:hypothetical protein